MSEYQGEIRTCTRCGAENVEVCAGDHCRACHINLSWESCTSRSWDRGIWERAGMGATWDKMEGSDE